MGARAFPKYFCELRSGGFRNDGSRGEIPVLKRRGRYYAKDGTPIGDTLTWAELFEDREYTRVAETILEDGTRISTIWLGLDHNFFDNGPPIIFESMVFDGAVSYTEGIAANEELGLPARGPMAYHESWDEQRYSTEAEAIAGHDALVKKWRGIREAWKQAGSPVFDKNDVQKYLY